MKALSFSKTDARERRRRYAQLRDAGMTRRDAVAEMGGLSMDTAARYERWYQAAVSGEQIMPGTPGPKARTS